MIKIGDTLVIKKDLPEDLRRSFDKFNDIRFQTMPIIAKRIDACSARAYNLKNNTISCRKDICPGQINGHCYGTRNFGFMIRIEADWDE